MTDALRDAYDVVVVGGGAAGLSGALMLARARRSVVVLDAGRPRNAPAEGVHGLLGREGEVIELSWYGTTPVTVELGTTFHTRRLSVRASQVSRVSPHRPARDYADRMQVALRAARNPALDELLAGPTPFVELPALMQRLAAGEPGLCHLVRYPG